MSHQEIASLLCFQNRQFLKHVVKPIVGIRHSQSQGPISMKSIPKAVLSTSRAGTRPLSRIRLYSSQQGDCRRSPGENEGRSNGGAGKGKIVGVAAVGIGIAGDGRDARASIIGPSYRWVEKCGRKSHFAMTTLAESMTACEKRWDWRRG
jgi:hypothetical protein